MSTRAAIAIHNNKLGLIEAVYLHHDGYTEYAGKMLVTHYNTDERARELIAAGNIDVLDASLSPNPEQPHEWGKRQPGVSLLFHSSGKYFTDKNAYYIESEDDFDAEYIYIFTDGKWYVAQPAKRTAWLEVESVLAEHERTLENNFQTENRHLSVVELIERAKRDYKQLVPFTHKPTEDELNAASALMIKRIGDGFTLKKYEQLARNFYQMYNM